MTKYFCWSFDDGLEQDKKIIRVLKKYDMGATFHLNAGLFGQRNYIGRIGNLGMHEISEEEYMDKRHVLPYVPHFRLPLHELKEVYEGFEIASHTCHHVNLKKCDNPEKEIAEDVKCLSEVFGQTVRGFAYPYGVQGKDSRQILQNAGIQYARTIRTDHRFIFPEDPLEMPMTCWAVSGNVFKLIDRFIREDRNEDMFFLMFAHGYEFDFGTKESNWNKLERICKRITSEKDVQCCSIHDALQAHGMRE